MSTARSTHEGHLAPPRASTLTPEQLRALALPSGETSRPTRVLVVGGGFAGVHTALHLTRLLRRRRDVVVELISEENYFVFQPLLPEVAAGSIAPTHAVNPIRELVPKARFRCARVRGIDADDKRVWVTQGEGLELIAVPYDHLVLAMGKVTNFRSMPGVAEHALPLKDLGDAFRLRNEVLRCLELADIESDAARRSALLTFVVAGGGFSGVETMGELAELVHRSLRYFPNIRRGDVRFVLIHAGDVILPEMPPSLGRSAEAVLRERGVELMLGARVRAASRGAVHLADGRSIATRTFVCTIGNAPNPIATDMLQRQSFEEARLDGRGIGVLATDETLRCKGRPGHWAVGDAAGVPSPTGKGLCPPTAQFAIRQAKTCAENIVATLEGRPLVPFRFKALGMLASLGQRKAVALMLGVRLTGFVAWFAWRTVYLMKLPGFARRLRVALDWTLDLFFHRDITQLQLAQNDRQRVHHFEDGETIITRGHIGRELFIVMNGRVDIEGERGEVIATLGPKSVFGEKAILEDTPRTATARANGPVDVLLISRPDFRALVEQLPPVREYFDRLLVERAPNAATATATETSAREASSPAMGS